MNWKYVKLLLLTLLLLADLLLLSLSYGDYAGRRLTDEPTAAAAAGVLEARGITVDPLLLAKKDPSVQILSGEYAREPYFAGVAEAFFGHTADRFYLLPDGVRAETQSGRTLILGNDLSVFYTGAGVNADEIRADLAKAHADPGDARTKLEKAFALSAGSLQKADCLVYGDTVFLSVHQTENALAVEGMDCVFAFVGEKCVFAEGKYVFCPLTGKENAPLLTRYNILLKEAMRGKSGTVTAITLCYAPYENEIAETLSLLPAYAVDYADGTRSVVSALDGTRW